MDFEHIHEERAYVYGQFEVTMSRVPFDVSYRRSSAFRCRRLGTKRRPLALAQLHISKAALTKSCPTTHRPTVSCSSGRRHLQS